MGGRKKDAIGQENDSCMAFSLIKLKRGSEGTSTPRNETRDAAELGRLKEEGCANERKRVWLKTNKERK